MSSRRDVGVLIAAAGRGARVGGPEPKQFRPISGIPMLKRSIQPFALHPRVLQVVVALPQPWAGDPPTWLSEMLGGDLLLVTGGQVRAESVKAALGSLDRACRIVLVHDAARPFVSRNTIDAVMGVAARCGAVPAVAVSDTIKRGDAISGQVIETIDRHGLWRAQTPQGCPREMLERAYEIAGPVGAAQFTDESALLEHAGFRVEIVQDDPSNFKVTTEPDFLVAEAVTRS